MFVFQRVKCDLSRDFLCLKFSRRNNKSMILEFLSTEVYTTCPEVGHDPSGFEFLRILFNSTKYIFKSKDP